MGDSRTRKKDGSLVSEGVLQKWTGEGRGLIKDNLNYSLVQFSASQFLNRLEGRRENIGRRCRYTLRTIGKNKLEACNIRLLPSGRGVDKWKGKCSAEDSKEINENQDPCEVVSKQKGKSNQRNQCLLDSAGTDAPWEVVTPKKKSVHKPLDDRHDLNQFLDKYRFLGKISSYDKKSKSGTVVSKQLEFGKLKFGEECMTGLGGGVIHPGRKIFFFVNYNTLPQVRQMTSASDVMTPQRVSGVISAWNGESGTLKLPKDDVQVLVHVEDVCLGSVTSIASGLKLNCTLSINPSHQLQAKEINLYTKSFRPRSLNSSISISKSPPQPTNRRRSSSPVPPRFMKLSNSQDKYPADDMLLSYTEPELWRKQDFPSMTESSDNLDIKDPHEKFNMMETSLFEYSMDFYEPSSSKDRLVNELNIFAPEFVPVTLIHPGSESFLVLPSSEFNVTPTQSKPLYQRKSSICEAQDYPSCKSLVSESTIVPEAPTAEKNCEKVQVQASGRRRSESAPTQEPLRTKVFYNEGLGSERKLSGSVKTQGLQERSQLYHTKASERKVLGPAKAQSSERRTMLSMKGKVSEIKGSGKRKCSGVHEKRDMNRNLLSVPLHLSEHDMTVLTAETKAMLRIKEAGKPGGSGPGICILQEKIKSCTGEKDLNLVFKEIKPKIITLTEDPSGWTIIAKFVAQVSKHSPSLERNLTRIFSTSFPEMVGSKGGCLVLKSCLNLFQTENRQILSEKVSELDPTQLSRFWVHGAAVFNLALDCLDERGVAQIIDNLTGQFLPLSMQMKSYIGIQGLISRARGMDLVEDIVKELYPTFPSLSMDRFGSNVLIAIIENGSNDTREKVVNSLKSNLEDLAVHPSGNRVVIAALLHSSSDLQDLMIEQVCREKNSDANTALVDLSHSKDGHRVVITMLEVSQGRSSFQELKTSLLFKKESLYNDEYAKKVLNTTRIL